MIEMDIILQQGKLQVVGDRQEVQIKFKYLKAFSQEPEDSQGTGGTHPNTREEAEAGGPPGLHSHCQDSQCCSVLSRKTKQKRVREIQKLHQEG